MATNPTAANGASIFQGVLNTTGIAGITYLPNQQRFDPKNSPFFNNQNFLQAGFPVALLPFTLPIARDFQYAYAQQGNLTIERDLGHNYKFSVVSSGSAVNSSERKPNRTKYLCRYQLCIRNFQYLCGCSGGTRTGVPWVE